MRNEIENFMVEIMTCSGSIGVRMQNRVLECACKIEEMELYLLEKDVKIIVLQVELGEVQLFSSTRSSPLVHSTGSLDINTNNIICLKNCQK
jgi:hypothetical protein